MTVIVGIDADIISYSAGFAAEGDPLSFCLHTVNRMIEKITAATGAEYYVPFLSGSNNFRDDIATIQPYKGNRANNNKPTHYQAIRDHLVARHGAVVVDGYEADDALGIFLTDSDPEETRICASIDKDLLMIPGKHYNWRTEDHRFISQSEADKFFFIQMLTGDPTDNIPGLYKLTGTKATKKIKDRVRNISPIPKSFYEEVLLIYQEAVEKAQDSSIDYHQAVKINNQLEEIGNLLWIRRKGYETWKDYTL